MFVEFQNPSFINRTDSDEICIKKKLYEKLKELEEKFSKDGPRKKADVETKPNTDDDDDDDDDGDDDDDIDETEAKNEADREDSKEAAGPGRDRDREKPKKASREPRGRLGFLESTFKPCVGATEVVNASKATIFKVSVKSFLSSSLHTKILQ